MSTPSLRRPPADDRAAAPRAGWLVVLCLMATVTVGTVVFAAAWIAGGRSAAPPESVASLIPADAQSTGSPAVSALAGGSGPQEQAADAADAAHDAMHLPGAVEQTRVHEVDVARLDQLKPLGWTVGHLVDFGFGFDPESLETAAVDGVRTVELHLAEADHHISVAETRPESGTAELAPLEETLTEILEEDRFEHQEVRLGGGEDCDLYVALEGERWIAAVASAEVQYVITSNLPESAAPGVADWVLASDRARVQILPGVPTGADRLERGLDELFRWID
ncbi:hypothetical protein [Nesterenkonia suensis]